MGMCYITQALSSVTCDDLEGRDAGEEEGDVCIHVADSLCCTAETSITL